MSIFDILWPASVWNYFDEICKIPRLSKNEGKIRKYLLQFASDNDLAAKEDSTGNILITRPASHGMQNRKILVLQSHMDMVGEKNSGNLHNWETDPIIPVIKGEWVTASGTTLGADDGIGIATQLAILTDSELITGEIECLFTVDEESGMTGAANLKTDFFRGRTLINLDSEDEGILYIGCAGGIDTVGLLKYSPADADNNSSALEISVTGLQGGHSGDEIHKRHGNSVKIMNRLLAELSGRYDTSLGYFDGGNLRNAIPREAFASVVIKNPDVENAKDTIIEFFNAVTKEIGSFEPDFRVSVKDATLPEHVMDKVTQARLFETLEACPHGVIAWSPDMEDLVETSTNLASVKFIEDNHVKIVTAQRSSVETSKNIIASEVESILKRAGADVTHSEGYPGWKPDPGSEILDITRRSYKKLFGSDPQVRAIHAGLECGLIYERFRGIDMISFGPTIKGAHTPEEKIEIRTVQMFWDLLVDVIKNIPDKE